MGTVGASDVNLATAKDKAATGASVYAANCAQCHGDRGQGRNAPQLLGAGGLPKYPRDKSGNQQFTDPQEIEQQVQTRAPGTPSREAFNHAGDLFDYVSSNMPPGKKAGSLKSEEYWAIVNFMLRAHGAKVPEGGVTPQNATTVSLDPQ
jgi:cytochrome c